MSVLLLYAFLAGVATVLSPCVLPILPALLAGSAGKGRMRPFGIIVGMILSFTIFTLSLTALVQATGISPNVLRYAAITLLLVFGLVLIFPKLSDWFAKITAPIANVNVQSKRNGFFSGILFGAALGLLWTPCAGPILAAITTLVATRSVDVFTVMITLAYSLGASIPLFLIAFGSNRILSLSKYTEKIRQLFGILTILTALAIALHWDVVFQTKVADILPSINLENNIHVQKALESLQGKPLPVLAKAPEIKGDFHWINSPPLTLEQLKGKTVLIDFWTYSCINCLRTLPYLEKWNAAYKDKGLVIIGVHTPEFEFEKDPGNVEAATKRLGVLYPVVQDNEYKIWKAFHNHYWPAHYLIDSEGVIRQQHFGEGAYVETENAIRELLELPPLQMKEEVKIHRPLSPETYLGAARGDRYVSLIKRDAAFEYSYHPPLEEDEVGLKGLWKIEQESVTSESNSSFLDYNFLASNVYLVLSGKSDVPIEVFLDGKPHGEIKVNGAMKYDVVKTTYGRHQLSLKVPKGISAYAFTFGDDSG